MTTEADTIRAVAAEAKETVVLTQRFYSCVVKDPKNSPSGEFQAVKEELAPLLSDLEEYVASKAPQR